MKRRDNGPMAAQAESKESASHVSRPIDKQATRCVASKADPKLWEAAISLPTKELETETDPRRRRNIEACLKYINENGYPYPDEVLIVMDGVVKHVTEDESLAMDWASLNASGKTDEAFLMVSRYPSRPAIGNFWIGLTVFSLDLSMGLIQIAWWRGEVELVPENGFPWRIGAWQCRLPRFAACHQTWSGPTGMVIILASWENGKTTED